MKNIYLLTSEGCITLHRPLVYDFKIRTKKKNKRKLVSRRKMWKLHKINVKSDFSFYIKEFKNSSDADASWFLTFLLLNVKKSSQIQVSLGQNWRQITSSLIYFKGILQWNDIIFPFNLSCSFFVWLIQTSLVYRQTLEF